jgi:periplasmic protein TonB
VQPKLTASSSAIGMSLATHIGALVAAGAHGHPPLRTDLAPQEISIDAEPPPAAIPLEEPAPNEVPEPAPVKTVAVHREALAVRAVAATESRAEATAPADAPRALAGDDALPHFTIATSPNGTGSRNLAQSSGTATIFEGAPNDDALYGAGSVDVPARAARQVRPRYPLQAQSSGIEGCVKLEIVLTNAGVVESVRALTHPGHGFEEEAIAAARKTPFTAAMKRGRAVAVRMAWTVEFQLQ